MEKWSEGVYLCGTYGREEVGCWLLTHKGEGAIVELPPYQREEESPLIEVKKGVKELGVEVKYLLCTHDHYDHIHRRTLREFARAFDKALLCLHKSFEPYFPRATEEVQFFAYESHLTLGGEPLLVIHAPKHSWSDTLIFFRGVCIGGDWEWNTIRSVHDDKAHSVPLSLRHQSIEEVKTFLDQNRYEVHKVFSSHANDRRENVDFFHLLEETHRDRQLW